MIYSVICTDVNSYIDWQCELLEYTWKRAGQPGELVRLVTCADDSALPRHQHARVVRVAPANDRNEGYLAFERLFALQEWIQSERPDGTVLILDPDCVFRRAVNEEVQPGSPRAQHWVDFDRDGYSAQPATWPALIHTSDLEALLPGWIAFTRSIWKTTRRWESDMTGFVSAAATLGLRFSLETIAAFVNWPEELVGDAPIVHYCQDVVATDGSLLWSKRDYQPWAAVAGGKRANCTYCQDLLALLNEYATRRRSKGA